MYPTDFNPYYYFSGLIEWPIIFVRLLLDCWGKIKYYKGKSAKIIWAEDPYDLFMHEWRNISLQRALGVVAVSEAEWPQWESSPETFFAARSL